MVNKSMANLLNQYMFGQASTGMVPSYWYIGILKTAIPITDLNGTITGKEISNSGYSRIQIPNTSDYFTIVSTSDELSYVANKNDITFPFIVGGSDVSVNGFFLSNQRSGGTAYIWGNLDSTKTLHVHSRVVIKAGALKFGIYNAESASGVATAGLIVDSNGVLSGNVTVDTTGVLS